MQSPTVLQGSNGTATGIRTPVNRAKVCGPRPLDDSRSKVDLFNPTTRSGVRDAS